VDCGSNVSLWRGCRFHQAADHGSAPWLDGAGVHLKRYRRGADVEETRGRREVVRNRQIERQRHGTWVWDGLPVPRWYLRRSPCIRSNQSVLTRAVFATAVRRGETAVGLRVRQNVASSRLSIDEPAVSVLRSSVVRCGHGRFRAGIRRATGTVEPHPHHDHPARAETQPASFVEQLVSLTTKVSRFRW
jgi:hypothetical protein